jgi:hypothetical protein
MTAQEQHRTSDVNINTLQSRRRLIHATSAIDDITVLLGLCISGKVPPELIATHLTPSRDPAFQLDLAEAVSAIFATEQIPTEAWNDLHQMWYRWKVPFGEASLFWWFLLCSALKETDGVPGACDLWGEWRDKTSDDDVVRRAEKCCALLDFDSAKGVVAIRDDVVSLSCLLAAALHRVALVPVTTDTELAVLENAGISVAWTDIESAAPSGDAQRLLPAYARLLDRESAVMPRARRSIHALPIASLRDDALTIWLSMTEDERTYTLVHLEQRIEALEFVRLSYGNQVLENDGIATVLARCRSKNPNDWSSLEMSIGTICWCWQETGLIIQEFNQSEVSLAAIRMFLERRVANYLLLIGGDVPTRLPLAALVERLAKMRRAVEGRYQRCLYFDGGNWERREFWIPKESLIESRQGELPDALRSHLQHRFGVPIERGAAAGALAAYLRKLVAAQRTPSELLMAVADWAANATDMPTDYAIFTVPYGTKLDRPWDLEIDEVFCYTAFREGFQPGRAGVPLKQVGIANAIGQRMRYNAVKKAQNYALVKHMTPQSFLLPDISVAEDAHQGGHIAAGVRHSCRVPMAIGYCGSQWKGIADVRLSRASYEETARFREEELAVAMRYGIWSKAIADETYVLGCFFDKAYCVNLDDGRDVASRLRRAS